MLISWGGYKSSLSLKKQIDMKTLADFKRRLKVGVRVDAIQHTCFAGRTEDGTVIYKDWELGVREVSIVQSNSFAFKTVRTTGEVVDSWCEFPKASECKIEGDTITIFEEDYRVREGKKPMIPVLTYKFV